MAYKGTPLPVAKFRELNVAGGGAQLLLDFKELRSQTYS
jgi:hypothetical protein